MPSVKRGVWGLFLLIPGVLIGGIGFYVGPPSYELSLLPGSSNTYTIEVISAVDTTLYMRVYSADWLITPDGGRRYYPADSLPVSCAGWIVLNPVEFELPPQGRQTVRMTINVPPDVVGEYWCVVFAEALPIPSQWVPMLRVTGRVGSLVFVEIAGTGVKQGEITNLEFSDGNVVLVFQNTGSVHLRPYAEVCLVNADGDTVWQDAVERFLVLPEGTRELTFPVTANLPSGVYTVVSKVDYGTEEVLVGERKIRIE